MGVISRYLERLTAIVRPGRAPRPAVSASAAGLRIGGESVAWADVRRMDAYKRELYVGHCLCLAILSAGDRVFEIDEDAPGWTEVGEAVDRFLPGSVPHAEWVLRLMATNAGESVAVYRGPAESP